MATYKVLQDIEAEDKLIGPLTLKQFIFAIITVVLGFVAFLFGRINIILAVPWSIPMLFFGFMASPIGRDQPNDVWLAARIRFLIKPRKRKWDQSGMQELVTITAPKKVEIQRTNGLNQVQVRSRLSALSSTLDSRGWAVKNVNVNLYTQPGYDQVQNDSERLIDISTIAAPEVPNVDVRADDDILDPMNNMIAKRFDTAIKQQRQENLERLKNIASGAPAATGTNKPPQDYSFITNPPVDPGYTTFGAQVVAPGAAKKQQDSFLESKQSTPSTDETAFLTKLHHDQEMEREVAQHGHERVINPLGEQPQRPQAPAQQPPPAPVQPQNPPEVKAPDVILKQLGQQSDDLSVASLASLAKHAENEASLHDNDVISLH